MDRRVMVLFGAGASHGSGDCYPQSPPLGPGLFHKLREEGGAFGDLAEDMARIFVEEGFEAGMASLVNSSTVLNPLQRQIAIHLSGYSIGPSNAYLRFFQGIQRQVPKISFATLNYDLLIEQALTAAGFSPTERFDSEQDPCVLKVHGSSNFLPEIPANLVLHGARVEGFGSFVDGLPTRVAYSQAEIKAWCADERNNSLSPALCLYAKGKRVIMNSEYVADLQRSYEKCASRAEHVFLVGVKCVPEDDHVWGPIAASKAKLVIADPFPGGTIQWAHQQNFSSIEVINGGFDARCMKIARMVRSALLFR